MYDKGQSWQININYSRHKPRFIRNFSKDEYSREEIYELEQRIKRELSNEIRTTGKNSLGDIVHQYLDHIEHRLKPKTVRAHKRMLFAHILPFFGNMMLDSIPGPVVDQYIKLRKKQIASKSAKGGNREINLELLCLSAVSKWAVSEKLAAVQLKLKMLPYSRPIPEVWTKEELALLFQNLAPRHRALYITLYNGGLRTDEAVRLTWTQVHFESKYLHVRGKRGKERLVPMNKALFFALWSHATSRINPHIVFPSKSTGGILTDIRKPLRTAMKKAGIRKRLTPHLLRHCFGSHALAAGGDLRTIQETLGHEQITTTQIYTHIGLEQKRSLVEFLE